MSASQVPAPVDDAIPRLRQLVDGLNLPCHHCTFAISGEQTCLLIPGIGYVAHLSCFLEFERTTAAVGGVA